MINLIKVVAKQKHANLKNKMVILHKQKFRFLFMIEIFK